MRLNGVVLTHKVNFYLYLNISSVRILNETQRLADTFFGFTKWKPCVNFAPTWYSCLLRWLFIPFRALLHLGNISRVPLESYFKLVTSNIRSSPLDTFYRLVSFQNSIKHTVIFVRFWSALISTFVMFRFYFSVISALNVAASWRFNSWKCLAVLSLKW